MEGYLQEKQAKPRLSKKQSSCTSLPISENNEHYYSEYKNVYDLSITLTEHLENTNRKQKQLMDKVRHFSNKIEDLRDPIRKGALQGKKKLRRSADEINKEFVCEVQSCLKEYATVASLKIHQKLKHALLYPSQRRLKSEESE